MQVFIILSDYQYNVTKAGNPTILSCAPPSSSPSFHPGYLHRDFYTNPKSYVQPRCLIIIVFRSLYLYFISRNEITPLICAVNGLNVSRIFVLVVLRSITKICQRFLYRACCFKFQKEHFRFTMTYGVYIYRNTRFWNSIYNTFLLFTMDLRHKKKNRYSTFSIHIHIKTL